MTKYPGVDATLVDFVAWYSPDTGRIMPCTPRCISPPYAVLAMLLLACGRRDIVLTPAPVPDTVPALSPEQDVYESTLAGATFGHVQIDGAADDQAYGNSLSSPGADQGVGAADARAGNEDQKSCGTRWTRSQSRATANFTPQHDATRRAFGFSLALSTYAKGGFWRGKVGIICRRGYNTVGRATASGDGRLALSYNAPSDISDQLIVRVEGASAAEANVQVLDGSNNPLPLSGLMGGKGVTTELASPGPYTIRSSLSLSSSNAGGGPAFDQKYQNISVSVQSMRDALSLGFGTPATETFLVPLPVFVPVQNIDSLLNVTIFTDQGRFYPCKAPADCADKAAGMYLEFPRTSVLGGAMVLDMHLSGNASVGPIRPGITGTIRASAVPTIEGTVLRLQAPLLEIKTKNFLLKYFGPKLGQKIVDRLAAARIDLKPKLDEVTEKAQEKFPITWGGACLLLDLTSISLRSFVVQPSPPGVIGNFGAAIRVASGGDCTKPS